jgi:hypothetical protein
MMLVRLDKVETDFLVSINVPHVVGEYAAADINLKGKKWGPLIERAIFEGVQIQKSLNVVEWSLFSGKEDGIVDK